jgi:hypothetical protein
MRILSNKKIQQRPIFLTYFGMFFSTCLLLLGGILIIEMSYHYTLKNNYSNSNVMSVFWQAIDITSKTPWVIALLLIASGVLLLNINWRKWKIIAYK